jgi:hypothetical protein
MSLLFEPQIFLAVKMDLYFIPRGRQSLGSVNAGMQPQYEVAIVPPPPTHPPLHPLFTLNEHLMGSRDLLFGAWISSFY